MRARAGKGRWEAPRWGRLLGAPDEKEAWCAPRPVGEGGHGASLPGDTAGRLPSGQGAAPAKVTRGSRGLTWKVKRTEAPGQELGDRAGADGWEVTPRSGPNVSVGKGPSRQIKGTFQDRTGQD